MSSLLTSSVHLPDALNDTARTGFAYVPSVLDARTCDQLRSCVADWPLHEAPAQVGPVRQRARVAVIKDECWASVRAVAGLAAELRSALGASSWTPNEATVMSYVGRKAGISPHRDHRRFGLFIAVISLGGQGRLTILADRAGDRVLADFGCRPGDLVLLRSVGLADPVDGSDPRPFHAVSGPSRGGRISLTFRMDTEAAA
jgi:hypothetical protein